jgi:hypothetical protein
MRDPNRRTPERQQLRRMHNGTRRYNGQRYLRILIEMESSR